MIRLYTDTKCDWDIADLCELTTGNMLAEYELQFAYKKYHTLNKLKEAIKAYDDKVQDMRKMKKKEVEIATTMNDDLPELSL